MPKIPTWLKIVVPLLLLLSLFVAAAVRIWSEEVPENARVEAIQARFAEQVAVLKDMAATFPFGACDDRKQPSLERVQELIGALRSWRASWDARADLFTDPAIMGVKIIRTCGDSQATQELKTFKRGLSFSRAMVTPPTSWPAVSLWFIGGRRAVKYEDRVPLGDGETVGFVLTLSLERLADGGSISGTIPAP